MPIFRTDYPYGAFNFLVGINGVSDDGKAVKGSFAEASGLDVEITPIEYRNGSEDIRVRKGAGLKKFTNIVLTNGITGDLTFWNWIVEGMNGKTHRTSGFVALLDESRQEVMRWEFEQGWPCKVTGPKLNAKNNEMAMETLEICHEGLSIKGQAG